MTQFSFDTFKFNTKLQAGGFTTEQAGALTAALSDAAITAELVTKADLKAEFVDVKADIAAFIAAMKAEFVELRTELRGSLRDVRTDMIALEYRMTIKLGGMLVVLLGAALTIARFMFTH